MASSLVPMEEEDITDVVEEPTCRLRTLNEDCLLSVFKYLGTNEYIALSKYDEYFKTLIASMVLKQKFIESRRNAYNFDKNFFQVFGESLLQIEIYSSVRWNGEYKYFVNLEENNDAYKKVEEHLLQMLTYTPNLTTFRCADRIFDHERRIVQCCSKIEKLDINYSGDRIDYFSNVPNLKCASFTSTPKAYQILKEMAERNKVEELKMVFLKDFTPNLAPIEQFTSLKRFELVSERKFNFDWVLGLLPNFSSLEELVVDMPDMGQNEVIELFEMVPWIQTYSIQRMHLKQLPASIRKLVRRICQIKAQQTVDGPINQLNLTLSMSQWREFKAIKNIEKKLFLRTSIKGW